MMRLAQIVILACLIDLTAIGAAVASPMQADSFGVQIFTGPDSGDSDLKTAERCEDEIKSANQEITENSSNLSAYNRKAHAFWRLGEIQENGSNHKKALSSFEKSKQTIATALSLSSRDIDAHTNKVLVLNSMAGVLKASGETKLALASYAQANRACDEAIKIAPSNICLRMNKAAALALEGMVREEMGDKVLAISRIRESVKVCEEASEINSKDIRPLAGKAINLLTLVPLLPENQRETMDCCDMAIEACDRAINVQPDPRLSLIKALALYCRGTLNEGLSDEKAAASNYGQALKVLQSVDLQTIKDRSVRSAITELTAELKKEMRSHRSSQPKKINR